MSWQTIKKALEDGYAEFTYVKVNGDFRVASGTRNKQVLAEIKDFTFAGKAPSDDVVCYWDFDREEWRCFRKDNAGSCTKALTAKQIIE